MHSTADHLNFPHPYAPSRHRRPLIVSIVLITLPIIVLQQAPRRVLNQQVVVVLPHGLPSTTARHIHRSLPSSHLPLTKQQVLLAALVATTADESTTLQLVVYLRLLHLQVLAKL